MYYISARYPDAFPDGAPFEIITKDQAIRALASAREIYRVICQRLTG